MNLTAKQEAFCQAIVKGMNQSDAYRNAYNASKMKDATVWAVSSKLVTDHKVSTRIDALRKPVIAKLQYGLEEAMREADDALKVSKSKENGGAMVAAVTLRAKLSGLLVERKEVKLTTIQQLADADLDNLITQKAREAGVSLH